MKPEPTPSEQGYRMPAEWEPHQATWLSWPYNLGTWEGHLEGAEDAFTEMIKALLPHEAVHLLVPDDEVRKTAMAKLATLATSNLHMHVIESGDVWFRDYGPIFVVKDAGAKRQMAYTKWLYNAYGNKYEDLMIGNEVPDKMPLEAYQRFDTGLVLEGGSVDVNGTGSVLTTESCLLSPDRNPGKTKEDIERALKDNFGVTNVLWLGSGVAGDDTTGHIDVLTRFVDQSTVVTSIEDDPTDVNYQALKDNKERLKTMKDERGTPLTVIDLPMPKAFTVEGRRMAATYANFYIANGVVLAPIFNQPSDAKALQILADCFPDRKIIPIDCRELIWGFGSIHCATQQVPLASSEDETVVDFTEGGKKRGMPAKDALKLIKRLRRV